MDRTHTMGPIGHLASNVGHIARRAPMERIKTPIPYIIEEQTVGDRSEFGGVIAY